VRVYLAADAVALRALRDGGSVTLPAFAPDSDDEADEFDALTSAAGEGSVVVTAEIDRDDRSVTLAEVQSFHLDADGSGDLAWYATQEIDEVLGLLG
jgi:hypothetical protein